MKDDNNKSEMAKMPIELKQLDNVYDSEKLGENTHLNLESNKNFYKPLNKGVYLKKNEIIISKCKYGTLVILSVLLFLLLAYLFLEDYKQRFSDKLIAELIKNNVANDPEKYKKLQEKIKIFLCLPVKMENPYLKEYADYYFNVHKINKMIVYDNNDENGEHPEDVLQEYIQKGLVDVVTTYRGKNPGQKKILNECYHNNKMKYDWMMIYDADEFLHLHFKLNVRTLLDSNYVKKNKCGCLTGNWLTYGDSDLAYYDNRTVVERFIKPLYPYNYRRPTDKKVPNINTKSIIKCGDWKDIGGDSSLAYMGAHTPDNTKLCNLLGQGWPLFNPRGMYYNVGYIAHYGTKTAEEYVGKIARSDIGKGTNYTEKEMYFRVTNYFFGQSIITEEKIKLFEKGLGLKLNNLYSKIGRLNSN